MIYTIKRKNGACDVINLDIFTMSEKLKPYAPKDMNILRYLRQLHLNNDKLSIIWPNELECSFFGNSKKEHQDINSFDGLLVLRMNAYELLKDELRKYGELLKLNVEGVPMMMFNPFIFGKEDNTLCEKEYTDGFESGYKSIVFEEDDVINKSIFKSKFTGGLVLYCNDKFKELVEVNNLSGLDFDQDLNIYQ